MAFFFFIADDKHRGKRLGAEVIKGFFNEFFTSQFKTVIVDPEKNNAQAIKCYEKAGFKLSNYSTDEKHLIMIKKIDMNHFKIEIVNSDVAEKICRKITDDLPEYFGLPEINEQYALGIRSRINLAVKLEDNYVGLASLEFPYHGNANIYWMGIAKPFQNQGMGTALIKEIFNHARAQGAKTVTVETLSPVEAHENYLKTYRFYEKQGFSPLFNLKPKGYEFTMVYMAASIFATWFAYSEKIKIRSLEVRDIDNIVANFAACHWTKLPSTFERYLREQENAERLAWVAFYEDKFAGYVTLRYSSEYPSFKNQNIPEISDLNVLPNYRSQGIGSKLLDIAEQKAAEQYNQVGLGVGLYSSYGMAQRLYFFRGYVPDGKGVTYNNQPVTPGKSYCVNDELILWLIKPLDRKNNGY